MTFQELVAYCGIDNLPEGLEEIYNDYLLDSTEKYKKFLSKDFLQTIFEKYEVPEDKIRLLNTAIEAIEGDQKLFELTRFLVWDMCSARNRCDVDNYQNMMPNCMPQYKEYYSFIVLLACVEPSMELLKNRGVPLKYYEKIPYQPMKSQLENFSKTGDIIVKDFGWDMNFYTCAIFLLDRFLFIPYKFGDSFTMYRNLKSQKLVALHHKDIEIRRDGQVDGINGVYDRKGQFKTIWNETESQIVANPINPMGFVEKEPITIEKSQWQLAMEKGDTLLAFHIPSGPGYNTTRLKDSMSMAMDFYNEYFPEMKIKGFWSESWLYDSRLSLMLPDDSNIISVQRQFYLYPIKEGDGMLRYELFGDRKADPSNLPLKTNLQKNAAAYMASGKRFNTTSMIVLKEEISKLGENPYIRDQDINRYRQVVDSHLD